MRAFAADNDAKPKSLRVISDEPRRVEVHHRKNKISPQAKTFSREILGTSARANADLVSFEAEARGYAERATCLIHLSPPPYWH
jgi:hypothetical protein